MPSLLESMQNVSIAALLGKDSQFKGTIRFTDSARIAGSFEGVVDSTSFLLIEESAMVKAEIHARDLLVAGEIHGDIDASGMVELLAGARVYGNIRTARIRVCDGVVFEGRCEMIRNAPEMDVFSAPIRELRKAIQLADEEQ